jgi:metal-responsive CopG/Arc/MetJ family transcriptional regulator
LTPVKPSYTPLMKTAISLPDPIFEAADVLAAKFKVSRSELYVMALEKFIQEHQETDVTNRINAFIEMHGQPVDEVFLSSSVKDMKKVEW